MIPPRSFRTRRERSDLFRVGLTRDLGMNRQSGRGSFIDGVVDAVTLYYREVLQNLTASQSPTAEWPQGQSSGRSPMSRLPSRTPSMKHRTRSQSSLHEALRRHAEQFRKDAQLHRIAEKLQTEFVAQVGHRPAPIEVHAWQNSLGALSMLLDQAQLNDHGVILEYQLGNTSRRLDAMLTGRADTSTENAVVVELKQWTGETIGSSTADNCVELRAWHAGAARAPPIGPGRRLPAVAARQPRRLLRDRCGRPDRRQLPPQLPVRPDRRALGGSPCRGAPPQPALHRRPVGRPRRVPRRSS